MILYASAKFHPWKLLQARGSVFPFAITVALPCACLAVMMKLLLLGNFATETTGDEGWALAGLDAAQKLLNDSAAFSGINFLLGFLIIFRTSQAYARFWEGHSAMHQMRAQFFDATCSLIAFSKNASHKADEVIKFHHTLVRLMSLLHATALMQLCVGNFNASDASSTQRAFELDLIDAHGIDEPSLLTLNDCEEKVALLFQWVQQLVVDYSDRGIFTVQPPILTRAFHELAEGMVKFHDALKIVDVPFPFPYMQTTELLLVFHWLMTPFLICRWTNSPLWTGIICFVWIFIFWSLNSIAIELENPFGEDDNDLPAKETQHTLNQQLLLLLRPSTLITPYLSKHVAYNEREDDRGRVSFGSTASLLSGGGVQLPKTMSNESLARVQRRSQRKISLGALRQSISVAGSEHSSDIRRSIHLADLEHVEQDHRRFSVTADLGFLMEEMRRAGERAVAEVWAPMAAVLKTMPQLRDDQHGNDILRPESPSQRPQTPSRRPPSQRRSTGSLASSAGEEELDEFDESMCVGQSVSYKHESTDERQSAELESRAWLRNVIDSERQRITQYLDEDGVAQQRSSWSVEKAERESGHARQPVYVSNPAPLG